MRWLPLALLVGCTATRSAEKTAHEVEQVAVLGTVTRVEERKVDQGVVVVKVTVEEFAPGGGVDAGTADPSTAPRPPTGGLVRRTVTEERREPVVVVERATEASATSTNVNREDTSVQTTHTALNVGPPWWVWSLLCLVVMALGYLAIRRVLP